MYPMPSIKAQRLRKYTPLRNTFIFLLIENFCFSNSAWKSLFKAACLSRRPNTSILLKLKAISSSCCLIHQMKAEIYELHFIQTRLIWYMKTLLTKTAMPTHHKKYLGFQCKWSSVWHISYMFNPSKSNYASYLKRPLLEQQRRI